MTKDPEPSDVEMTLLAADVTRQIKLLQKAKGKKRGSYLWLLALGSLAWAVYMLSDFNNQFHSWVFSTINIAVLVMIISVNMGFAEIGARIDALIQLLEDKNILK